MDFDEAVERFDPVLGLEVHVELGTATKMFDAAPNQFGATPNSLTTPTYNGGVPSGAQAMPYQPNGGGTSTMPNTGYGYGGAPGQQGYYPPQQGGQGYGQYPPTYR